MMVRGLLAFSLISMLVLSSLAPPTFAATCSTSQACADGTKYYECSTKTPGYRCMCNSASGTNSLQLVLVDVPPTLKCACDKVPGYTEVDGQCVKSTCTVNGQTVQAGTCKDSMKCVNGAMVEDAAVCGCPSGKVAQEGVCVERKGGCRWSGSVKCLSYQECKFDANKPADDGICQTKTGCQYSQYNGQACNVEIETCNQNTGKCDKIAGACVSNSECTGGKTCNLITKRCEEGASAGSGTTAPLLGAGAATPPADAAAGAKPTFCCLPAALGAMMVGLAFVSRRRA